MILWTISSIIEKIRMFLVSGAKLKSYLLFLCMCSVTVVYFFLQKFFIEYEVVGYQYFLLSQYKRYN